MSSYEPYNQINKKSNLLRDIKLYSFLISFFSLALIAIIIAIYKSFTLPKEPFIVPVFYLYILNSIACIVYLFIPIIPVLKFMLNFKKEIFNDLICEIDNDEQNIQKLLPYSLAELNYSIDWLNLKTQRLKSRINNFFGEKTAVLSIVGLAYSAVQSLGGLNKLGDTISKGLFNSGAANTIIAFGLTFLLGLSLGALVLKHIANHLQYLKEVLELTIKTKQRSGDKN